jgi:hypothetical protein
MLMHQLNEKMANIIDEGPVPISLSAIDSWLQEGVTTHFIEHIIYTKLCLEHSLIYTVLEDFEKVKAQVAVLEEVLNVIERWRKALDEKN